jgi:Amiloride-sensitive sodium channel
MEMLEGGRVLPYRERMRRSQAAARSHQAAVRQRLAAQRVPKSPFWRASYAFKVGLLGLFSILQGRRPKSTLTKHIATLTTCHGIKDWYDARTRARRLFWVFILSAAIGGILFYTWGIMDTFITARTVTTIKELPLNKLPFPNLTICHSQKLNLKAIKASVIQRGLVASDSIANDFALYVRSIFQPDGEQTLPDVNVTLMEALYQKMFNSSANRNAIDVKQTLKDWAIACKSMMYCSFSLITVTCCDSSESIFCHMGVCQQLTLKIPSDKSPNYQQLPGYIGGLFTRALSIDLELEYLDDWSNVGLTFHIGNKEPQYDRSIVHVSAGYNALIRLSLENRRLDPVSSNCTDEPPRLLTSADYSQEKCWKECAFNMTLAQCGCASLVSIPPGSKADVCSPLRMYECALDGSLVSIVVSTSMIY